MKFTNLFIFIALAFNACSNNISNNDEHNLTISTNEQNELKLLKTGQNISYVKGDDGDLKKGIDRNFTLSKNSVIDNANKLQWQDEEYTKREIQANFEQKEYGKSRTWKGAVEYCLKKGDDWRLPNIKELSTIIDYKKSNQNNNSKFDEAFRYALDGTFWSSTKGASEYNSYVFTLQSKDGIISSSHYENNEINYVRCVKNIR